METAKRPARVALLAAALLAAAAPAAAQEIKLAVFDPQRVSELTAVGRSVQTQLTSLRDRKQTAITEQEQAIAELQRQLTQQELSLSPDRRSTMERDIQSRILQLESAREVARRELQLEVAAAQASFEEKLLTVVQAFGKERGLTMVLTRELVAWADDGIDVTDAIIQRFDSMFPGGEAGGSPPAP